MPECKWCKKQLKWKKPYNEGDRPVEVSTGKPHQCSKSPFKKSNKFKYEEGFDRYKYNAKTLKETIESMNKVVVHCDECGVNYTLSNPCDDHLPDGPYWRERRKKRAEKYGYYMPKW